MFEQIIFEYIRDNFTVSGFDLAFGFGEVPENTLAPYIIQYSLDINGDKRFLCNDNDFTDGEAFIQWNIYHPNSSNAFYIKNQLMTFIAGLQQIPFVSNRYMLQLNQHESSPSGADTNTGLFAEIVARSFTYNLQ